MIPLAILCAVLVVIAGLGIRATFIYWRQVEIFHNQILVLRETREELIAETEKAGALISEAYALLHDERHKGKMGNQATWQAARDEWSAKVKGAKA